MNEISQVVNLIEKKEKLVALLAPSFPIVYQYPNILVKLKRLGFSYVIEVSAGAKETNRQLIETLKANPTARFITSPCATFSKMVKTKYPNLLKYVAFDIDSPMVASAKIAKERYLDCKIVFIGPCIAKKLEANEIHPELGIIVITYKELNLIFSNYDIDHLSEELGNEDFDVSEKSTRIYPTDGGLTITSGAKEILGEEGVQIVSGWQNCEKALNEFETNTKVKLLDLLFCEGGCVNGPGIPPTQMTIAERNQKIFDYAG